jgi:hypothetical protein
MTSAAVMRRTIGSVLPEIDAMFPAPDSLPTVFSGSWTDAARTRFDRNQSTPVHPQTIRQARRG